VIVDRLPGSGHAWRTRSGFGENHASQAGSLRQIRLAGATLVGLSMFSSSLDLHLASSSRSVLCAACRDRRSSSNLSCARWRAPAYLRTVPQRASMLCSAYVMGLYLASVIVVRGDRRLVAQVVICFPFSRSWHDRDHLALALGVFPICSPPTGSCSHGLQAGLLRGLASWDSWEEAWRSPALREPGGSYKWALPFRGSASQVSAHSRR